MTRVNTAHRKNERGITIVLVAVSLLSLLGMAALAIDVSTLYMAHGEAQRAADASALAGARMFASSGYTTSQIAITATDICQTSGPGGTAAANRQAEKVAAQNLVAGQPAAVQEIFCPPTATNNPQIRVTVQRIGLPTFFGRIWGGSANSVTATAWAEAYNPSGSAVPILVQGVKPWLVPDCDPSPANPGPPKDCANGGYFVDPTTTAISSAGSFVGETITLKAAVLGTPPTSAGTPQRPVDYYALNVPVLPTAPACPSPATAVSCGLVRTGNDYHDNIACASNFQFSCGQVVGSGQTVTINTAPTNTDEGVQCLIHAGGQGPGFDQDELQPGGSVPDGTPPITLKGGNNNPNPALRGATNISRSDSIVTIPIYHKVGSAGPGDTDLCPTGTCSGTGTIVGFLQLGIQENSAPGQIKGVIMNVAGCNAGVGGISGGGVSPIPVRLIHP